MCGIVGYIGSRQSTDVLLDGLSKLEYRGYDSAGVALCVNDEIRVVKAQGRLAVLAEKLNGMPPSLALRHRAHTLGYARRPQRRKQPSPLRRARQPGAQRHH